MSAHRGDSPTWPYVLAFAEAMEAKLEKNRHKGDRGGWLKDTPGSLHKRLREEVAELKMELDRQPDWKGDEERFAALIAGEAADVANFAMMIADVCGSLKVLTRRDRQGWAMPRAINGHTKRFHYFIDGRSMCGGWGYLGDGLDLDTGEDNNDDCRACRKRLRKMQSDEVRP